MSKNNEILGKYALSRRRLRDIVLYMADDDIKSKPTVEAYLAEDQLSFLNITASL